MKQIADSLKNNQFQGKQHYTFIALFCVFIFILFTAFQSSCDCNGNQGSTNSGDTTSSNFSSQTETTKVSVSVYPSTVNPKFYTPGEQVQIKLTGSWTASGNGRFIWTPPYGATNIQFPAGRQPLAGGPPYIFDNLTLAEAEAGFQVSYNAPEPWAPSNDAFSETLTIKQGNDSSTSSMTHYLNTGSGLMASDDFAPVAELSTDLRGGDPVTMWRLTRFTDIPTEINQSICEDLVEQAKLTDTFTAWRLPLADAITANQSYTLPISENATAYPKTTISNGLALSVEMPMEIRTQATQWANQYLPKAEGEMWVAIGVKPDAEISCPDVTKPNYSLVTTMTLDLSNRPGACQNCLLPSYLCYKTGSSSSLLARASWLMDGGRGSTTIDGYTCLGPAETQLVKNTDWRFEAYTSSVTLKPGDSIQLHYWIENNAGSQRTFNLAAISTLSGAGWVIHPGQAGDPWQPDLEQTVGSSIDVPASGMYHLHITGSAPSSTTVDTYNYRMTVTNAEAQPDTWIGSTALIITADGKLPNPGVSETSHKLYIPQIVK